MANGTYGSKKPAFITSNDVDIFYSYRPTRSTEDTNSSVFKQLDSNILYTVDAETSEGMSLGKLPGLYNLRLPLDTFGRVGFYTVYIKPREIKTSMLICFNWND